MNLNTTTYCFLRDGPSVGADRTDTRTRSVDTFPLSMHLEKNMVKMQTAESNPYPTPCRMDSRVDEWAEYQMINNVPSAALLRLRCNASRWCSSLCGCLLEKCM